MFKPDGTYTEEGELISLNSKKCSSDELVRYDIEKTNCEKLFPDSTDDNCSEAKRMLAHEQNLKKCQDEYVNASFNLRNPKVFCDEKGNYLIEKTHLLGAVDNVTYIR